MNQGPGITANGFVALIGTAWAVGYAAVVLHFLPHHRRHATTAPRINLAIGQPPTSEDARRQQASQHPKEQPVTDLATPVALADPVGAAVQRLAEDLAGLGVPVVLCLGCTGEYVQAAARGTAVEQLPPVHPAQLVVGGNGQCLRHVQFTDRPVMPGQTASGLYLAGQG